MRYDAELKGLRYGSIMIMADQVAFFFWDMGCQLVRSTRWLESQDTDGSHIKGLLLLGLEKGIFESRDICGFSQDVLIYVYLLIIS